MPYTLKKDNTSTLFKQNISRKEIICLVRTNKDKRYLDIFWRSNVRETSIVDVINYTGVKFKMKIH